MKLLRKLRALFRKEKLDTEMAEEMRMHLELQATENERRGMTPDDALCAAQRQFGGLEQIKEVAREQRGWIWLEQRGRDVRFAFRSLGRSRSFSLTVIVTLTLCIGANTAILSALQSLILKPLPFRQPGQLVEIYTSLPKAGLSKLPISVTQYFDYKANADLFESFALFQAWPFSFGGETFPVRVAGAKVTADYFRVLDLQPLLGRFPPLEECMPGRDHVVVLTQTFWESHFGANPSVIGTEIRLSGEPFTVIGVAPRSLETINHDVALLKPFDLTSFQASGRLGWVASMYARVKTDEALNAAEAQLVALENRFWETATPGDLSLREAGGCRLVLAQVRAEQTKSIRNGLVLLQGAALMVLLLGIVNVANLMLVRTNTRRTEFAVRYALGSGRGALVSQLLTESSVLVGAGTALGVALASTSLRVLNAYKTAIIREAPPIVMDSTVLGLASLGSIFAVLVIGLLPILQLWRESPRGPTQGDSRGAHADRGTRRISRLLITSQVALALMLLVGASLLIRSYARVQEIKPGFDAKAVLHARVALNATYKGQANIRQAEDRIIAAIREIPGVQSVAVISGDPVEGQYAPHAVTVRRAALGAASKIIPTTNLIEVSPDFFATLGISIVEGRGFIDADKTTSSRVYVVDRNFAEKYYPGRSAIGERFEQPGPSDKWPVIVGVADVARFVGADDRTGRPVVYTLLMRASNVFSIVLRTVRSRADLLPLMREKLSGIDPSVPIEAVNTFENILDDFVETRRGIMWLLVAFALIALLLAAVGIFGMLAYDVSRRTKEIAIRGALGATPREILALVLRQGLGNVALGLALGCGGALYLTRFMQSMLFEVQPWDALVYSSVSLVLLAVALLACWLPPAHTPRRSIR